MKDQASPAKKRHFDLVDVMRAFAAVSVLVCHAIYHFEWSDFPQGWGLAWFRIGWMGVDIFFVISGFVIALSALNLAEQNDYASFQKKFMLRRARRIVPLYYLTLALFIFVTPEALSRALIPDFFAHVFFIHNTILSFHSSINGANWSVATEMQFYLLISLGIYIFKTRNLLYISLIFLAVCYLWRFICFIFIPQADTPFQIALFVGVTQLPGMLDLFLGGILLAFFVRSKYFYMIFSGMFSLVISALFSAILCYITLEIYSNNSIFWDNIWMVVFFRTLTAISVGFIILTLCQIRLNNIFRKILSPIIYLGTISYGIYLFHLPVMLTVKRLNLAPEISFIITAATTLLFAALSWEFFEKKFLDGNSYVMQKISAFCGRLCLKPAKRDI